MPTNPNDTSLVSTLTGDIGSDVLDSVVEALDAPLLGWLGTFLGFGGSSSDPQYTLLESQLSTILGDLANLNTEIGALIQQNDLIDAYNDIIGKTPALPSQWVTDLTNINTIQSGTTLGATAYITNFITINAPRFYTDVIPTVMSEYVYYLKQQFTLMNWIVDACHAGLLWPSATTTFVPAPCNYPAALFYLQQYINGIQQQLSFVPFPLSPLGLNTVTLGVDQIILDKNPANLAPAPSPVTPLFAWGHMNCRNASLDNPSMNIQWILDQLEPAWMLRLPTMAELQSLPADALNSSTLGFDIQPELGTADRPTPMYFPFPAAGATTAGKPDGWYIVPEEGPGPPVGYQCDSFYDLQAGQQVSVAVSCQISDPPTALSDILGATAISWVMFGSAPEPQTFSPGTADYLDALFIYQFADANPFNGLQPDPPVEEPAQLIVSLIDSSGSTTSFRAQGMYSRVLPGGTSITVPLDVTQNVYWTVNVDPSVATVSNQQGSIGVLTWGAGATAGSSVTVTAQRGTLTQMLADVSPGPGFTPPAVIPQAVNIYPRIAQLPTNSQPFPATIQFNMQVLNGDGSVSDPSPPPGNTLNSTFTFASSDTIAATPVAGNEPGNYAFSGGTRSGQITITATLNGTSLSDSATITVPAEATFDTLLPTLGAVTTWLTALYQNILSRAPSASELATAVAAYVAEVKDLSNDLSAYRQQVVTDFVTDGQTPGTEYCTDQVTAIFKLLLDRAPTSAEIAANASSPSWQSSIVALCGGSEFQTNNPVPTSYVVALYQRLLGRAPNAGEDDAYIESLQNGTATPTQVATDFVTSTEYCTDFVSSIFQAFLARTPGTPADDLWITTMQQGQSMQQLVIRIAKCDEFLGDCVTASSG